MIANDNGNEPTGTDETNPFGIDATVERAATELVMFEELTLDDLDYHLHALTRPSHGLTELFNESFVAAEYADEMVDSFDRAYDVYSEMTDLLDSVPSLSPNTSAGSALKTGMGAALPAGKAAVLLHAHLACLDDFDESADDEPTEFTDATARHAELALELELLMAEDAPSTVHLLMENGTADTVDAIDAEHDEVWA